ncbi:hypothetical protein [Gracilibacillus sp. YIM 98692]|uniref:hypothetical protein n=1 Tax=Gracilibacillus sp. YIM 98692 TaxID=2663532 RepID=UPI0013D36A5C|nr:hypothetical protein [Gracilibacillus sp. YIM 98692]
MKTKILHTFMILAMISFIILVSYKQSEETEEIIKYFPHDTEHSFLSAFTKLTLLDENKDYFRIKWDTDSILDDTAYLRQDISLLYMDGQLKGIKGLWKEDEKQITLHAELQESDSSHFQVITFHHGEIHYPNDVIKSVQMMTDDYLYVIDSPYTPLEAFRQPSTALHREWKQTLDRATKQHLHYTWKKWITEANIDLSQYKYYPLIDMIRFQDKPIDGLSQDETNKVIGQLWEGLYKNYILPISSYDTIQKGTMPLILFDKNNDHIIVLYKNQENKLEKLYQNIAS